MKRKNIINLIFLAVLIIATAIILVNNKNKTLPEKNTDFSVSDTAAITRIFIADQNRNTVVLEKNDNGWFVNGKYRANIHRVSLLLDVLKHVELKNPAPESFKQDVINDIASFGKKVEIYLDGKKPYRSFFVGGATQDEKGTYFKMARKGAEPYVVHIPGWEGYLTDGYFYVEESEWRTKTVLDFKAFNIQKISLKNNVIYDHNLELTVNGPEDFSLYTDDKQLSPDSLDNKKVISYLSGFENLQFVELATRIPPEVEDSIRNATPVYEVSVTGNGDKTRSLKLYFKPATKQTRVEFPAGYDKEYMLGIVSNRPDDLLILQTLVLQRILWKVEDFK